MTSRCPTCGVISVPAHARSEELFRLMSAGNRDVYQAEGKSGWYLTSLRSGASTYAPFRWEDVKPLVDAVRIELTYEGVPDSYSLPHVAAANRRKVRASLALRRATVTSPPKPMATISRHAG